MSTSLYILGNTTTVVIICNFADYKKTDTAHIRKNFAAKYLRACEDMDFF